MTQYMVNYDFVHDITIITVSGGCEEQCAREMEMIIDRLMDEGYKQFILDVSGLNFVETPGLRFIINKVVEIQSIEGALIIVGLSGLVKRVFDMLKLGSTIPTADDVESAIARLNKSQTSEVATGTDS
jgi:anti-anti-sigma factor